MNSFLHVLLVLFMESPRVNHKWNDRMLTSGTSCRNRMLEATHREAT